MSSRKSHRRVLAKLDCIAVIAKQLQEAVSSMQETQAESIYQLSKGQEELATRLQASIQHMEEEVRNIGQYNIIVNGK